MSARLVQSLNLSQSARMHEFRDETGLWAIAGSASPAEDMLERGARADDAIRGAVPRNIEPESQKSDFRRELSSSSPHAAAAAG